jgi:hypothetical protein
MPEIIIGSLLLFAAFGLPYISGAFARSIGRPFWLWFTIGCAVPFISVIILYFLPDKTKNPNY